MKLETFVAAAILALAGCSPTAGPPQAGARLRVACIGDSITYGAGIDDRESRSYPMVLGRLLGDGYVVANFGHGGATLLKDGDLPFWNVAEHDRALHFDPDLVVLMLGTNDSKPQNWAHKDRFEADLNTMIDELSALPRHPKIWLCAPPPAYAEMYGIRESVIAGEIIPIVQKVAKQRGLSTIDLHAAMSGHPEMFPDNIHPDAVGAERMAKAVAEAVQITQRPAR